jgi:hypothetical protein
VRRGVRHPARGTRWTAAAALIAERDHDLFVARRAPHARKAVGKDAASQILGELALDVTGQPASFGVDRRNSVTMGCACCATSSCSTVRSGSRRR